MRRQRGAVIRLAVVLILVLGAAAYFLKINPIYNAIHKGLDLQGGEEIVYQAFGTADQPLNATALQRTLQVIEMRVNSLGVSEPVVQADPTKNRIIVQLAGVKDPEKAQQIIGQTAKLEFKDAKGNVIVTGSELQSAEAASSPTQGNYVALNFNAKGKKAFAAYTAANQGKIMSIYVDGKDIEDPVIQPGCCPAGNSIISGNFSTFQDAQNLAIQLNSGALPLTLTVYQKQAVSATLGADSVRKSELAAAVAMAFVIAFMFLVYRVPGLWADLALLVYAVLSLAVLAGIKATLTLPGITGLILSIGMAVDSNVIIFERIKEELRSGRSLRLSVDEGFKHGLRAIVDSNMTTLIAALVLYYLGSGLIRGFAVTVGIGVVISLLTAVVFTRYLLHWLVDAGSKPSWWFFAPRAAVATVGVHAAGMAAPTAPIRAGRTLLGNLRRDWQAEMAGATSVAPPVSPGASVDATPEDATPQDATEASPAPSPTPARSLDADADGGPGKPGGPYRRGPAKPKRTRRGGR